MECGGESSQGGRLRGAWEAGAAAEDAADGEEELDGGAAAGGKRRRHCCSAAACLEYNRFNGPAWWAGQAGSPLVDYPFLF